MSIAKQFHVARPGNRPGRGFAARVGLGLAAAVLLSPSVALGQVAQETSCSDGKDDDGDTVVDCADADCFADPACQPDGGPENSDARCSDWVDNDSDGYTDCDDSDCLTPAIAVCKGSAQLPPRPGAVPDPAAAATAAPPRLGAGSQAPDPAGEVAFSGEDDDLPFGKGGDIDGERNDFVCSDGIDNDNDGRTDCEDFGCRFDPTVTICQGSPDLRFSVVARAEHISTLKSTALEEDMATQSAGGDAGVDYPVLDARFTRLQLRAFGPLPFVEDSFYLLSSRFERTPRLTFAMFQIPVGKRGDYVNVNSGSGGMSNTLVRSAHKRLLLDPPFYLLNAFEQGNGAAVEVGGPVDKRGKLLYRTMIAGGTGRFTGNVGGRFVSGGEENFSYSVGAQLHYNAIGYFSRWDSPMLYTPASTQLGVELGVKYEQRTFERFPALNVNAQLRHRNIIATAELYAKYELDFETIDYAYNVQLGVLVVPRKLLFAVDFGEFIAGAVDAENLPDGFDPDELFDLKRQETQARAALHYYLWRNVLVGSLLFVERCQDPEPGGVMFEAGSPLCKDGDEVLRELRLAGTYRF